MNKHFNIADMYELVADKVPSRDAIVCGEQRATFKSDLIDATAAVYNPLGDGLSITMSEPGGPSETITIPPGDPHWKVASKLSTGS